MPRMCSVFGCKSNYRQQGEAISTFSLPKDSKLKDQWIRKIPTDFSKIKNPVVCIRHFTDTSIMKFNQKRFHGVIKTFPRKYPKLREGAVPTIFSNAAKYLSDNKPSIPRLGEIEDNNMSLAIKSSLETYKDYIDSTTIHCVQDLVSYFDSKIYKRKWTIFNDNDSCVFCYMGQINGVPTVLGSIVVYTNLSVEIFIKSVKVSKCLHPDKISSLMNLNNFDVLMTYVENKVTECSIKDILVLENIIELLEKYFLDNDPQIKFVAEQLRLLDVPKNRRRYCGTTMLFAARAFIQSKVAYDTLHNSKLLCIPHPQNLKQLINKFSAMDNT